MFSFQAGLAFATLVDCMMFLLSLHVKKKLSLFQPLFNGTCTLKQNRQCVNEPYWIQLTFKFDLSNPICKKQPTRVNQKSSRISTHCVPDFDSNSFTAVFLSAPLGRAAFTSFAETTTWTSFVECQKKLFLELTLGSQESFFNRMCFQKSSTMEAFKTISHLYVH